MKKLTLALVSTLGGAAVATVAVKKVTGKSTKLQQNLSEKHLVMFLMMNQWVTVKQDGKNLADYFEEMGYKTIAIYGMSYVGERLWEELKGSEIEVKYGIDQNADFIETDMEIVTMDDKLESVDAVIVTPIFFFDEIKEKLSKKIDCPIISLEDVIYKV